MAYCGHVLRPRGRVLRELFGGVLGKSDRSPARLFLNESLEVGSGKPSQVIMLPSSFSPPECKIPFHVFSGIKVRTLSVLSGSIIKNCFRVKGISQLNFTIMFSSSKNNLGDFPGGPVARTPHSQCRRPGFDPWSGTRSHMPQLRVCMSPLKIPNAETKTRHSQIS